jgi:Protein of unknown function (DUF2958)
MKLLLNSHVKALRANAAQRNTPGYDPKPVVKFFNPCGAATWLFAELEGDGDTMFGLCDLGMGTPELGYASLAELSAIRTRFGLGIERDMHWKAAHTLSQYAATARRDGRITT